MGTNVLNSKEAPGAGRETELSALFEEHPAAPVVKRLISETVFLENEMERLRDMPHVIRTKGGKIIQTSAGRVYGAYYTKYASAVKILSSALAKGADEEESPLRLYLKQMEMR
ncbi:MAG: hypothetical protein LBS91_03005 [Clostridiales Family XIII bacterium]|jgi:hypothetical protein|nr:hypothetical protein [Clostridiales Family XIII bacterium]